MSKYLVFFHIKIQIVAVGKWFEIRVKLAGVVLSVLEYQIVKTMIHTQGKFIADPLPIADFASVEENFQTWLENWGPSP